MGGKRLAFHWATPHCTGDSVRFSHVQFGWHRVVPVQFIPVPVQISSAHLVFAPVQFSPVHFTSFHFTSVHFTSLRLSSVFVSVQFHSVQPSSVRLLVTSRVVAVHFSVGEGSVLFVSFPPQFSSVRSASFPFKVPKVKLKLKLELNLNLTL